tara:strand:- start:373 stop:597 length:225 start_codon:yes stop_codon:yes gene_type:complete
MSEQKQGIPGQILIRNFELRAEKTELSPKAGQGIILCPEGSCTHVDFDSLLDSWPNLPHLPKALQSSSSGKELA